MKMTTITAFRDAIAQRRIRREFVARGLASRDEARRTGKYVDAENIRAALERMLEAARRTKAAG
ncbi:hypothetical protein [Burkholderia stabilis]|uniref:hypothetical protein n=1 Tax=Burkholderia stabilis TaxID=95485 RepID=UPI001FC88E9C|nr:hypothetical protein [Burkholderia stabilis]